MRRRLHARLDHGLDLPVTVVAACPGSGKRSAVRDWVRDRALSAVWVAAHAGRSDPAGLAGTVAAGIARLRPHAAQRYRAALAATDRPDPEGVARAVREAATALGQPLWLVLDAGAGPLAPEAADLAARLLADPPQRLRLLLVAREVPDLPLARLRLEGQVNEIAGDHLRFTPDETAALLRQRSGRPATAEQVAVVMAATAGWGAGVAAFALALAEPGRVDDDRTPAEWAARGQRLADGFVREEILAPLDSATRDLLVRTALLETVDLPTAEEALAGRGEGRNARRLLDALVAADLAAPAGDAGPVRVHAFLRPTLRGRFEHEVPPDEARSLAKRLARRCVDAGRTEEAIGLHVAADDVPAAVGVLAAAVDGALAREAWPLLERWLARLPAAALDAHPEALLARAWVAHLSGRSAPLPSLVARIALLDGVLPPDDPGRMARATMAEVFAAGTLVPIEADPAGWLPRLSRAGRGMPPGNRFGRGMAEIAIALALLGAGRGEEAVARLTDWVANEADPADAGYARGLQGLAFLHWQAGNLDGCQHAAEELLGVAAPRDLPVAAGWARRFLARVAHERNQPAAAEALFAAATADPRAHRACIVESAIGLAACHVALGHPERARKALAEAVREATLLRSTHLLSTLHAAESVLLVRSGLLDPGEGLRRTTGAALDQATLHAQVHPLAARIELLLQAGSAADLDEAGRHLDAFRQRAAGCCHLPALALAEGLAAALADRQGNPEGALAALGRAADLAVPAGLGRTLLDLAPLLRPVVAGLPAGARLGPGVARVAAAIAAKPDGRGRVVEPAWERPSPLEVLTVREAEVFALLARRMTYQEIGEALSISAGTVKFHLGSVYGKLGVEGRRAALLRAADLGWNLATRYR